MRIPIKRIVSIIALAMTLLIVAIITLPYFFNPNDFKPQIAEVVKEQTGRNLDLQGVLKFSFFPWLGISTGRIVFSNAPGFDEKPFASLEESIIKIKLLSLFTKKIETSGIVLKNLVLNLARNTQGVNNWDDLFRTDPTTTPSSSTPATASQTENDLLKTFAIGGINIENAQINWQNQQTGKQLVIKSINLDTGRLVINEPIAIDLSFVASNEAKLIESIQLTTALIINEKLDHFVLNSIELHSITEGGFADKALTTTGKAGLTLDLPSQSVKISGLQVESGDLKIAAELNGTHISEHALFEGPVSVASFNPAKVLHEWGITLPVMQDGLAFKKLAFNADLQASADSATLKNLSLSLDNSQMKGSIDITDFLQPAIGFNLAIDSIDVDRYLPPTDKKDKPLSSPASALAIAASSLPVETLKNLNFNGELSVQNLKISDLKMQAVHLKLNAKDGSINTQQSINHFYQGIYSGHLNIDTPGNQPALSLDETFEHVQIEPLLTDYQGKAKFSGIVTATAKLKGQGKNTDSIKSSLNGQLTFQCQNGVIKGFNLQKIIDSGKSLVEGTSMPNDHKNDQTLFSDLTGTATVKQGLIQNDDLVAKSSKLHVNGKGQANLNTEKLDYQLTAKLLETADTELKQFQNTPIVVHVGGTFDDPTFTIDMASILTEQNKAKIEKIIDKNKNKIDKLMNKLDKKIGPGASDFLKRLF
ncbi:MAG: AsmA family protein [Methylococcaceae bacterium]|nr:AsmA family protein [Methylococcaceae bacterium]